MAMAVRQEREPAFCPNSRRRRQIVGIFHRPAAQPNIALAVCRVRSQVSAPLHEFSATRRLFTKIAGPKRKRWRGLQAENG